MKFFFFRAGTPYQNTHGLFQDAGHYFHHGLAGPISAKEAQKLQAFMGGEVREYNAPHVGPDDFLRVLHNFDVALEAVRESEGEDATEVKRLLDKNLTLDGTTSTYLSNAPTHPKVAKKVQPEVVEQVDVDEARRAALAAEHVDAEEDVEEDEDTEDTELGISLEELAEELAVEEDYITDYNEQITAMSEGGFDWMQETGGSRKKSDVAEAYDKFYNRKEG